ncbi:TIGR03086 family metal-binding protein [Streptomyces sp. NPDC051322]|uniref:TIGR03086 family metal-binding protein n=1 Tax=Streptomyces sp. NPDC051322 TaxID=3154645 RepID=UPI00344FE1B1
MDTENTDTETLDTEASPDAAASLPDFESAARHVAELLDGIGDQQLKDPTPCPDYAVRELIAHLVGLTAGFRDAAGKVPGPNTDTTPDAARPELIPDWRTVLPRQLDELVAAWHAPEAWEGITRVGGVTLPGGVAGRVGLNELVIHGWDLARSTGQDYAADPASLGVSYGLLEPADALGRGTIFGPPVAVPDDAPFLDRVIGLSGRDPQWTP